MSGISRRALLLVVSLAALFVGIYYGMPSRHLPANAVDPNHPAKSLVPLASPTSDDDLPEAVRAAEHSRSLNAPATIPSGPRHVRVVDAAGAPVRSAAIVASGNYFEVMAPGADTQWSDADGRVVLAGTLFDGEKGPWLLASHPQHSSSLVEPTDDRWRTEPTSEIVVQLRPSRFLRVEVSDRRGRRIEGATVTAYATRGREAEWFSLQSGRSTALRELLAPTAVTDADGAVVLALSSERSCELAGSKLGYCESYVVFDPATTTVDRVALTLDAIVAGGIKSPDFDGLRCSVGSYSERGGLGDGGGGVRRADFDATYLQRLELYLESRLGVRNVQWHFGIEVDPGVYPVRVPIGFRALPGDPFFKGELRFKLLDEIELSDILTPPETMCERLEIVTVRFIDEEGRPTVPDETLWAFVDATRRHWRIAKLLPDEDRADLVDGRLAYTFRVPAGQYFVVPQVGMAKTQPTIVDETRIVVEPGQGADIRLRAKTKQTGSIRIRAQDELGRPIRFGRVVVSSPRGGVIAEPRPSDDPYQFDAVPGSYTVRWVTRGKGASDPADVVIGHAGDVVDLRLIVLERNEGYSDE